MIAGRPRRVLFANVTLAGRTGTETALRDLALGLRAAGDAPVVYAPALGDLAADLRDAGVPVVADLGAVTTTPDVIHGHHHVETMAALWRFPATPAIFVCHDRTAAASAPPRLSRVRQYVAVDRYCLERLTGDAGLPPARTRVIPNAVDLARFQPRGPLPPRPARAAIFSNYAEPGTHLDPVREACARIGLPLDVIGAGVGRVSAAPERDLPRYDLVFAKARCALEAMAVGCAVILCDATGLGPLVTTSAISHLRDWNFGRRTLTRALDADAIADAIRRYDADDATRAAAAVRDVAGLDRAVAAYQALYDEVLREPIDSADLPGDLHEYASGVVLRLGALESTIAALREPLRMDALHDEVGREIDLTFATRPPNAARPGDVLHPIVRVGNRTRVTLGTFPPYPLHVASRWLDAETGAIVVVEGARTVLPSIAPGASRDCVMRVDVPARAGRLRLRATLVQEDRRWLDQLDTPVAADAEIVVGDAARPS